MSLTVMWSTLDCRQLLSTATSNLPSLSGASTHPFCMPAATIAEISGGSPAPSSLRLLDADLAPVVAVVVAGVVVVVVVVVLVVAVVVVVVGPVPVLTVVGTMLVVEVTGAPDVVVVVLVLAGVLLVRFCGVL